MQAADELAREHGRTFDVIDLRSIFPYDWDLISQSVLKTGRVLIVNEDTEVTNFGEHLLRRVVDEHFYDLAVRPRTLMGKHVPGIGMNQNYEVEQRPAARRHPRRDAGTGDRSGLDDSVRRNGRCTQVSGQRRRCRRLEHLVKLYCHCHALTRLRLRAERATWTSLSRRSAKG